VPNSVSSTGAASMDTPEFYAVPPPLSCLSAHLQAIDVALSQTDVALKVIAVDGLCLRRRIQSYQRAMVIWKTSCWSGSTGPADHRQCATRDSRRLGCPGTLLRPVHSISTWTKGCSNRCSAVGFSRTTPFAMFRPSAMVKTPRCISISYCAAQNSSSSRNPTMSVHIAQKPDYHGLYGVGRDERITGKTRRRC